MNLSTVLLALSIITNIAAYIIYLRLIFKNKIKPHAFTFLTWTLLVSVNFVVQVTSGVGESSLLLACNALFSAIIFIACIIKGYTNYDRTDWLCLGLAIMSIILWIITNTPLYSVILTCFVDLFGMIPSFRKSFRRPYEDSALTFFISGMEFIFSFPSYQVYSFLVLLYPILVMSLDFGYAGMIWIRRVYVEK